MDPRPPAYAWTPTLRAVLNAAIDFGLTREEAWRTFNDALSKSSLETAQDYFDAVAGSLAHEILVKQRRLLAG